MARVGPVLDQMRTLSGSLIPVSSQLVREVLESQIRRLADLSVMTASRSPSLSQPKQEHIPGSRSCSTRSACLGRNDREARHGKERLH